VQAGTVEIVGKERYRPVPLRAVNYPPEEESRVPAVMETTHGTIKRHRDWLITRLQDGKVSLALSGHIHRNSVLFVLRSDQKAVPDDVPMLPGGVLAKGTAKCIWDDNDLKNLGQKASDPEVRPLFVNTTSAGLIGGDHLLKDDKGMGVLPGYTEVVLRNDGAVMSVERRYSQQLKLQFTNPNGQNQTYTNTPKG
jgi:hypothetical protein